MTTTTTSPHGSAHAAEAAAEAAAEVATAAEKAEGNRGSREAPRGFSNGNNFSKISLFYSFLRLFFLSVSFSIFFLFVARAKTAGKMGKKRNSKSLGI